MGWMPPWKTWGMILVVEPFFTVLFCTDLTVNMVNGMTVPVKLAKAPRNTSNKHEDASFIFATKGYLQGIASHFGPVSVFAVSIDDKAKVPIGITAAKLQAPLVMVNTFSICCLPYKIFIVEKRSGDNLFRFHVHIYKKLGAWIEHCIYPPKRLRSHFVIRFF